MRKSQNRPSARRRGKNIQVKLQKVKLNDLKFKYTKYIVKQLGSRLTQFFSYTKKIRKRRTTLIKKALALLGDKKLKGKPHYKVYANGLSRRLRTGDGRTFKDREWLYDLHWYTEVERKGCEYQPKKLPLVVECEWEPERKDDKKVCYSGFKYDFQKLLVANAELRLMIFILRKKDSLQDLDDHFEKAIERYNNLAEGSKFLFIAFDKNIPGFHYAEKFKEQKRTNR